MRTFQKGDLGPQLFPHQKEAIEKLGNGSILCGGVGTGKSITAVYYFLNKVCGDRYGRGDKTSLPSKSINLYIITTARKRDTNEWLEECNKFRDFQEGQVEAIVDSWNNIHKYEACNGEFFIFDEQRVVGSGAWVKSFLRITKKNKWVLLSATPGDTWMDYIPVFVANGFYKNRSEFLRLHAVYNRFSKYPKVDRFIDTGRLEVLRRKITVNMEFHKKTVPHYSNVSVSFDKDLFRLVAVNRWNPFEDRPIKDIGEVCYLMRKVVNSDPSRLSAVKALMKLHPRIIIFYNHDHELDTLRSLSDSIPLAEWNGHKHEPIPQADRWVYLVQYMSGAEGWNCVETDTIIFYSQNYSYKMMTQAAGRIDRLNTPYTDLYYYILMSSSSIDQAISKAIRNKKMFNEEAFLTQ